MHDINFNIHKTTIHNLDKIIPCVSLFVGDMFVFPVVPSRYHNEEERIWFLSFPYLN